MHLLSLPSQRREVPITQLLSSKTYFGFYFSLHLQMVGLICDSFHGIPQELSKMLVCNYKGHLPDKFLFSMLNILMRFTWMDGWVRVLRPFDSISVISRRWKGEHERLCAMKRRLGSGRISPPAGFEPVTPWSEVGSANRSATRTLQCDSQWNASSFR